MAYSLRAAIKINTVIITGFQQEMVACKSKLCKFQNSLEVCLNWSPRNKIG